MSPRDYIGRFVICAAVVIINHRTERTIVHSEDSFYLSFARDGSVGDKTPGEGPAFRLLFDIRTVKTIPKILIMAINENFGFWNNDIASMIKNTFFHKECFMCVRDYSNMIPVIFIVFNYFLVEYYERIILQSFVDCISKIAYT